MENYLITSQNRFAFKLFAELARQESGRNIFISPASIMLALAMTYNGAHGETQRAMAEALELGRMSLEDLNHASHELLRSLNSLDPQIRLAIANSLWARQGIRFRPEFLRRDREFFGAEIRELDFAGGTAAPTINGWVREHTGGKIEKIVDQIDRSAILFLINAIYFKGDWTRQFERRLTREGPFTLRDGRQVQRMMMSQSGKYSYYEGGDFQAVSLPYGNGRLSMYLFLPGARAGLESFYKTLDAQSWDAWMGKFHLRDGNIALPRFKIEYGAMLNEALKVLGMGVAFTRRADFSEMAETGDPIYIDEVRHKTFVEVNEEGTEAAAVTSVGMTLAAFIPERRFSMVVDRPFFCAIRDNQTGAILFMGAVVDPLQRD